MKKKKELQRLANRYRIFRSIHRVAAVYLFSVFIVVSATGLLLGWKKHSGGILLPASALGSSAELRDWLPLDSLYRNACNFLADSVSPALSNRIDRIDIRKDKGMVKFVFADHFYGIQLDGATGELLQVDFRRSDLIEKIHDGSILDFYLGTEGGQFKLFYTSLTGLSLLLFTLTGFWIWYIPRKMRKLA